MGGGGREREEREGEKKWVRVRKNNGTPTDIGRFVPRPVPSFSLLGAEKRQELHM